MSDDGDEHGGSYAIFYAEGEVLFKQGLYDKALECFSKALDYQAEDKACLVARSRCYLSLGDTAAALKDAEDSLNENKMYHKGLYQKAEVLYAMGDFEHALMFYHRGHNVRPQMDEFTLGIQKAQEAINNSIGSPAACKLETIGDLSFFHKQDTVGKKKPKKLLKVQITQQKKERKVVASEKSVKELLGELYSDRDYLDKLMKDPNLMIGGKDRAIYNTIEDALIYLDSRTEFWRQQKPMYARKREKEMRRFKPAPTKPIVVKTVSVQQTEELMKVMQQIDDTLSDGDAEDAVKQARKLLKTLSKMRESDVKNKQELLANVHSTIGSALINLGEVEEGIEHYLKDLEIAEKQSKAAMLSRALDNMGKVNAWMGQYEKAIIYYERKLPLIASAEERAWLMHELGRCRLGLGEIDTALDLGHKCLESAEEAQDDIWILNADMLIAQSHEQKGDKEKALEWFRNALKIALLLDNGSALVSINEYIERLVQDSTDGETGDQDEGDTDNEAKHSGTGSESKPEASDKAASDSLKKESGDESSGEDNQAVKESPEDSKEEEEEDEDKEEEEEEGEEDKEEGEEDKEEKEKTTEEGDSGTNPTDSEDQ